MDTETNSIKPYINFFYCIAQLQLFFQKRGRNINLNKDKETSLKEFSNSRIPNYEKFMMENFLFMIEALPNNRLDDLFKELQEFLEATEKRTDSLVKFYRYVVFLQLELLPITEIQSTATVNNVKHTYPDGEIFTNEFPYTLDQAYACMKELIKDLPEEKLLIEKMVKQYHLSFRNVNFSQVQKFLYTSNSEKDMENQKLILYKFTCLFLRTVALLFD